jgi:hypothetical protein
VKLREEFEADQQKTQETEKAEATKVKAEYKEVKIKREPSIEIKDVEIEMSDESDATEASSYEDDEMDEDAGEEEESTEMFAVQASSKSSFQPKKVPVSTTIPMSALQQKLCKQTKPSPAHRSSSRNKDEIICPRCPKTFTSFASTRAINDLKTHQKSAHSSEFSLIFLMFDLTKT